MFRRELRKEIGQIIENDYKMEIGAVEKVLDIFFFPDFMPRWYFYSNTPGTIARHIYLYTQLLNANSRYIEDVADNGKTITYFINVGRDTPGRLERIVEENLDMDIGSIDSEYTKGGVTIVTLTKRDRSHFKVPEDLWGQIKEMLRSAQEHSIEQGYKYGNKFLNCIQLDYLTEEVTSHSPGIRLKRHMKYFEEAMDTDSLIINKDFAAKKIGDKKEAINEKRLALSVKNPPKSWVVDMLKIIEDFDISMNRVYFDLIDGEDSVGILSIYFDYQRDITQIINRLLEQNISRDIKDEQCELNKRIDSIIRTLTSIDCKEIRFRGAIENLTELCLDNSDISKTTEYNNFYLNSVSDFFKGAEFIGIDKNLDVLSLLLGYQSLDEFFVSCREGNKTTNKPGFRAKHNSSRGPCKGGLRIDPIVRYDEVAALSFMMTWKCARSKILFGGGKGGLKLNPRGFSERKMDFFDTLSNFGRSIFSVTGPARDVPAGDVGCGAREIGHLFEGFKSALRDLSLLVYGVKKGVSLIGNNLITLDNARSILLQNFDIDYLDREILHELSTSEEYLNLVAAASITGKPNMGIQARTGATGRGLCYSILQTVANLYLHGDWKPETELTEDEVQVLKYVSSITQDKLIQANSMEIISNDMWLTLEDSIYPKLFEGKKVAIQGSGKVGSSILKELSVYGVNLVGVADAGGAIFGNNLDVNEILKKVAQGDHTVIGCRNGVTEEVLGAKEGVVIISTNCDILIPAALENAITLENVNTVKAKVVACGSNGPCSSKAEQILFNNNITVIYDFLANGAGVIASYFEWLRNLYARFKYEAVNIRNEKFSISVMDKYIMPEFETRIKKILQEEEGEWTTREWNLIIRDIIFCEVNEDLQFSSIHGVSMKTAGFINTILRVLSASIIRMDEPQGLKLWEGLNIRAKELLNPYLRHPEVLKFTSLSLEEIATRFK